MHLYMNMHYLDSKNKNSCTMIFVAGQALDGAEPNIAVFILGNVIDVTELLEVGEGERFEFYLWWEVAARIRSAYKCGNKEYQR